MGNEHLSAFSIEDKRNRKTLDRLLQGFGGILTSDRYSVYGGRAALLRQVCLGHVDRNLAGFSERKRRTSAQRIAKALRKLLGYAFHFWHRLRDGTMSRAALPQSQNGHLK